MTRAILLLGLSFFLYSCNSTLRTIEKNGCCWVKLGLYDPLDPLIFDFKKREIKTVENKLYKCKVKRNTFYWTDDRGPEEISFSNVIFTGDTLKISEDDFYVKFLKCDRLVAPKMIVADSLVGRLFKGVSTWGYNNTDSVTTFIEFVSREKGVFHLIQNATGAVYSREVFSWTLHQVDGVFLMASFNWMGPRFLITDYSNDTIRAVRPTVNLRDLTADSEVKGFGAKHLMLMEDKSLKPKVLMEDLIGEWEVTEFKTPYYQSIWSVRIMRDQLFINEHGKGLKLNVPWYLDRFGNLIKADLKGASQDQRWDIYKLSIYFIDGKLIFADGRETYTLKLKP